MNKTKPKLNRMLSVLILLTMVSTIVTTIVTAEQIGSNCCVGIVEDPSGARLPGSIVTINGMSVTTDYNGMYSIPITSPGQYSITVSDNGYMTHINDALTVTSQTTNLWTVLTPVPSQIQSTGIIYDYIQTVHTLTFGSPIPTNDRSVYGTNFIPNTQNTYVFDLKNFPLDDFPSGGFSQRISSSEMIMANLVTNNGWFGNIIEEKDITFHVYRPNGEEFATVSCGTMDKSCVFFTGHFDQDINQVGRYAMIVTTTHGGAEIAFDVIDTTGQ